MGLSLSIEEYEDDLVDKDIMYLVQQLSRKKKQRKKTERTYLKIDLICKYIEIRKEKLVQEKIQRQIKQEILEQKRIEDELVQEKIRREILEQKRIEDEYIC